MSNEFDAAVTTALQPDTAQSARVGFSAASDTNPDAYAEAKRVARRTGVPVDTVFAMPNEIKRQDAIGSIDFDALAKTSPSTAALLADVEKAKVAHDDVPGIGEIERKLRQFGGGAVEAVGMAASGAGRLLDVAQRSAAGWAGLMLPEPMAGGSPTLDSLAGPMIGEGWQGAGKIVKNTARNDLMVPAAQQTFGDQVAGGLGQVAAQILMLPFTRGAGLYAQGADAMGEKIDGDNAPQWKKDLATVGGAGITGITEKWALDKLLGPMVVPVKNAIAASLARIGIAATAEGGQEFSENVLQDSLRKMMTNSEAKIDFGQSLGEGGVGAAVGGIVRTVVEAGLHIKSRGQQAQQATQMGELLTGLNTMAEASKLVQRDTETAQGFFQSILDEGRDAVYISPEALAQSGLAEQMAQAIPAVAEQLQTAAESGHDIRIPIADLMATMAGPELEQSLLPHVAVEPGGFTPTTAQEYLQSDQAKELQAEVDRVLGEKEGDDTFKASAQAVKTTIKDQLTTAGRFTESVNDAYSSMVGNFYAVQAARMGTTPEAMFGRYPLRIGAESIAGQQFDQAAIESPDFRNWFGDSKVVDGSGNPMVVYHGTTSDFNAFQGNQRGVHFVSPSKTFVEKFYTSADGTVADGANVMPVYVKAGNPFDFENKAHIKQLSYAASLSGAVISQIKKGQWSRLEDRTTLEAIKSLGFDGLYVREDGHKNLAVFDPTQIKSAIGNNGQFDPNDANILNQQARGSFNPATLQLTLLKNADLSTFFHESAHFFLEVQADLAGQLMQDAAVHGADTLKPGEQQVVKDMQATLDWFGIKDLSEWNALDFEEKRSYHEKFARGFESYLFGGKAPSIELQGLFQRFRAWMMNVYRDLKALNVELTDEVRGVFDRMLATTEQITLAEQGRSMMPLFTSPEQIGMTPAEFADYQALGTDATNEAIEDMQARGLRDMQWIHNARGRVIKQLQKESAAKRAEVKMGVRAEVMSQPIYRAWQFLTGKMKAEDQIDPVTPPKSDPNVLDETIDSLFAAIAKLGGINKDDVVKTWGVDPADKPASGLFGKPLWRIDGGLSIDGMAEALSQYGYLEKDEHGKWDIRELEDKFKAELGGDAQYSNVYDYAGNQPMRPGDQVPNRLGLAAGRLDRASLTEIGLPPEIIDHLDKLRMVRKDGIHPDIVAEMFGFTSGDELVRRLAAAEAPKAEIEALTDQRMLEQFGDLSSEEDIKKAADKAIHNDVRARLVATELAALEKATGKRTTLASAAKEYAAAMIARLKVRDIKPGQYAAGEVRAAKATEKASKAGDIATAAAEKRNQLINTYATRAAYDAQDEVEKGLRYLKTFDSAGKRKGLDADYTDQIDALLERFDLRKGQSGKAIDKRKALAEWLTAQQDAGLEPDIPQQLVNEAFRKSYKDMTVEELRGLIDTIKQIEHLGRLKHKLLTARDQRAYEAIRDEIAASIVEHAGERKAETRTPDTVLGKSLQKMRNFWAEHIKSAMWARIMDGGKDGGPMWEYFVRAANERGDMETTMRAEATAKLSEILDPVFKLGKMQAKVFFPLINRSLTREARIAIALNVGNASNLQRLQGGEGWTDTQLAEILRTLTVAEWQAVQKVWDHFESYRPQIAAKERRVYGKEPEWIAPTPFTVQTADGQSVQMRGGYYPVKYDPAASQRAEEHADAEGAKRQLQGAYTSATTRRSFTKARAEEVNGRPLLYSLAGVYSGVNDVIHDLSWHEWLIDTNRLLRSQTIDSAIRNHYGPEVKQQFKKWSADIAEGDKASTDSGDIAVNYIRQSVSVAGLGFNVMSAAIQPLGITQSIVRVGAKWVGRGIAKYIAHPIELTKEVNSMSSFMENRARTRFRELNELRNQVEGQTKAKEFVGHYAYFLMMRFQQAVDVPTWWGAYEKAVYEGNDDERAASLADQAVIDAQGGGMLKDQSGIERTGATGKLFTVFYSFMNTAMNMGVAQTMTEKSKAKLVADYALLYLIPPMLGMALKAAITPGDSGDDDPEKIAKKLLAAQIDYMMGMMVYVREFSDVAKTLTGANDMGRDYQGPAGLRLVVDAGKFAKQVGQGEFDDAFRKASINLIGDLFGLPSAQLNRTITGIKALAEGETENPAAIAFGFQKPR
ncbi:MAG: hypothetical protein WA049_06300 [Ferribacterium limneticum]